MTGEQHAVVELTLRDGHTLGDLIAFAELAVDLGFPRSSTLDDSYPSRVVVRHYLGRVTPSERRRDPSTGRFVRAVS